MSSLSSAAATSGDFVAAATVWRSLPESKRALKRTQQFSHSIVKYNYRKPVYLVGGGGGKILAAAMAAVD